MAYPSSIGYAGHHLNRQRPVRWMRMAALTLVAVPVGALVLDGLVWTLRGSPTALVPVSVITAMELKGQKADYGEPETQQRTCNRRLLVTGTTPACWWLRRHRELI